MTLRELRLIVQRNLLAGLAVFAICVAVGAAAAFVPDKQYASNTTLVIGFAPPNVDASATVAPTAGGSVQQASFLLPALEVKATSRRFRDVALANMPEELRRFHLTTTASVDTSVMRIRTTSTSPQAAQAFADELAKALIEDNGDDGPLTLAVLDQAQLRRNPVAPNVGVTMFGATVFGLLAGFLSTLVVERVRYAFDSRQAIRDNLDTTVLGEIPKVRALTKGRATITDALENDSFRRAIEHIRDNLELRMSQLETSSITVVSFSRGSGKSTVAAALSLTRSWQGYRTCLVEADLRRPDLTAKLGTTSTGGLADFGLDRGTAGIWLSDHLGLVPAGLSSEPIEALTRSLENVVSIAISEGFAVFVDSPPFDGAPESEFVVRTLRHVVLVANDDSIDLGDLPKAMDHITRAGGNLVGVVLNRVPARRLRNRSYYGKGKSKREPVRAEALPRLLMSDGPTPDVDEGIVIGAGTSPSRRSPDES